MLLDIIFPLQTAFVPGRKGVDNAIIVQELIHTISRMKGKHGVMAIKIDLEKAYDRLEWSFIGDTLHLFKFPEHLISLVMNCVSSSAISVLYNGGGFRSISTFKGDSTRGPSFPLYFYYVHGSSWCAYFRKMQGKALESGLGFSRGNCFFPFIFCLRPCVIRESG